MYGSDQFPLILNFQVLLCRLCGVHMSMNMYACINILSECLSHEITLYVCHCSVHKDYRKDEIHIILASVTRSRYGNLAVRRPQLQAWEFGTALCVWVQVWDFGC